MDPKATQGRLDEYAPAFANLFKAMVGSGLLTLPYVTSKVGIGISIPGLAICAFMTQYAVRFVVKCAVHMKRSVADVEDDLHRRGSAAHAHGSQSWLIVARASLGAPGVALTTICLVGAQLGVTASYLSYVGNTFMAFTGLSVLTSRIGLWIFVSLMCLLRPLQSVAFVSGAALCVYAALLMLVCYYGARAPPHPTEAVNWGDWSEFGTWFGPAIFAFEGVGPAVSIYESMGHTDSQPFFQVLTATYGFAVVIYGSVAVIGYVAWGSAVAPVVIDSFPPTLLADGARLMLALILALTYPIQITPVFQMMESLVLRTPATQRLWPLTRCAIVGLTAFASFLIPDMEKLVALTGGVFFSLLGFCLPGIFYLRLRPPADDHGARSSGASQAQEVALAIAIVTLGVVGGVFSVYAELFR